MLRAAETDHAIWTYGKVGINGAFRLVSVLELLSKDNPRIRLTEWYNLSFPRDGLGPGLERDAPPDMPRYCAISHVWEASEDAGQRSKEANRSLEIDLGKGRVHTISWLGLVQAAIAAESLDCEYIWLDLLCLDQTSAEDKTLQIQNMARIYSNASSVVVMVGGIHAAQGLETPSAWIHRAWTFQEATLCFQPQVLVQWDYPGSFSGNSSLSIKKLRGTLALVALNALLELTPGKEFEAGTLITHERDIEYELGLAFNCLGIDQTAIIALQSSLRTVPIKGASQISVPAPDSDYTSDLESWEDVPEDESDDDAQGSTKEPELRHGAEVSIKEGESDNEADDWTKEDESDGYVDDSIESSDRSSTSEFEDDGPDAHSLNDRKATSSVDDSDLSIVSLSDSVEKWAYYNPRGDRSGVVAAEILHEAAWRNIWLRTSTKPQDLVFSVMHYLGVSIKVDYKRDIEDLIFELVAKSPIAGWLTIGFDIPVYPRSGLVPILPTFASNSVPTYSAEGGTKMASELVYSEYYCVKFDVVVTSSGKPDDGHLLCGRLFEIKDSKPPHTDERDPLFYHSELRLSSPEYEFYADCKFKGSLGIVVMIVGATQTLEELRFGYWSGTPFVHLLEKNELGTWSKTGAGFLDEPVFKRKHFLMGAVRRHLHVGGDPGSEISECDCEISPEEKELLEQLQQEEEDAVDIEDVNAALFEAASKGDEKLILKLLDMGADINAVRRHKLKDKRGTPLHAACSDGKSRIVRLLVEKGADINARGRKYGTSLQTACYCGWESVARVLLERGAIVNSPAGPNGTALQCAMKSIGLAKLLLEFGADPNATGGEFGTCLMTATQSTSGNAKEIIQLLLDKGADINSTYGRFFDGVNEGGFFNTALQVACNAGELRRVRFLLVRGADPNKHGEAEHTVLQLAAKSGWTLIMKELIEYGADVHAQRGEYGNALQAAARAFHGSGREPARLLLDHGVDINVQGGQYGNALQAAVCGDMPDEELVKFLLAKGADVNARGGHYGTALQGAAASDESSKEVIRLLLQAGADVNATGGYYGTALQAAAASIAKSIEIIELLLRAGADVNGTGGRYGKALQAALHSGHKKIARILIDAGADIHVEEKYQNSLQKVLSSS